MEGLAQQMAQPMMQGPQAAEGMPTVEEIIQRYQSQIDAVNKTTNRSNKRQQIEKVRQIINQRKEM